jgi:tRNA uridine 5-carboxymethylaminomethyl modification enzyme
MMTCRAEYRMMLRQDNADLRLTEKARRTGLISPERYDRLMRKKESISLAKQALEGWAPPSEALNALLREKGSTQVRTGVQLESLLKRSGIGYTDLMALFDLPAIGADAIREVEAEALYGGYIRRQEAELAKLRAMEAAPIPEDVDFMAIGNLRTEARQKLSAIRPRDLGAASRISGVSPADIAVLTVYLKARTEENK